MHYALQMMHDGGCTLCHCRNWREVRWLIRFWRPEWWKAKPAPRRRPEKLSRTMSRIANQSFKRNA